MIPELMKVAGVMLVIALVFGIEFIMGFPFVRLILFGLMIGIYMRYFVCTRS